jgi:hypothetical protein
VAAREISSGLSGSNGCMLEVSAVAIANITQFVATISAQILAFYM